MSDRQWRHFRWFDPHPAVPREGSVHMTRRGVEEAVCDECGEAIGHAAGVTDPRDVARGEGYDPDTNDRSTDD